MSQTTLFAPQENKKASMQNKTSSAPFAYRFRPDSWDDFFGQINVFSRYPFLKYHKFPAVILWGPPGCGKTTLAHLMAKNSNKETILFSPVLGGVSDLKKKIEEALIKKREENIESVIFIDEIHRFNKAQQDALLPYVEAQDFTLIGATTENPKVSINPALLSRVQIVELKKLNEQDILHICSKLADKLQIEIPCEVSLIIANFSDGDARKALNFFEIYFNEFVQKNESLDIDKFQALISEGGRKYDRDKNRHYDVISAFIKSIRGSDPNAAILWLAVMLDGGEDPFFIARRLVILASEDIGNADPSALNLAVSGMNAIKNIGMPEARIILSQVTIYLSSTVKSNASYLAIDEALEYVKNHSTIEVPEHLKNFPSPSHNIKYDYPHSHQGHFVAQNYLPKEIPLFFRPTSIGKEENIKNRLNALWQNIYNNQSNN